jgi:hypothetical protein
MTRYISQAEQAEKTERNAIYAQMKRDLADHIDPVTNEVDVTLLAESAALALGHGEWLNQEYAQVWDVAVKVAAAHDRGHPDYQR